MTALGIALAQRGGGEISFQFDLVGIIALAAGILILIFPRVLNYIVAAYLIVVGLITLFNVNL
ncbi:MAG TPA: DUF3096 domain-containing protein [Actinomycetota bacterium]|nr:DUF3096 domain-containing protein [Actinomycetota bacterium]